MKAKKAKDKDASATVIGTLLEIRDELRLLRKDVQFNKSKNDELKREYGDKFMEKFFQKIPEMYKSVNLGKMVFPGMDLNEVKKNTAGMMKFMMRPEMLEEMPEDFKKHYFNILNSIGKPNDPIYEEEAPPDPREPLTHPHPDLTADIPEEKLVIPDIDYEHIAKHPEDENAVIDAFKKLGEQEVKLNANCPGCGKLILPYDITINNVESDGKMLWHRDCMHAQNQNQNQNQK